MCCGTLYWLDAGKKRGTLERRGVWSKVPSLLTVSCCAFAPVVGPCQIVFTFLKDVSPLEAWEWMENSFLQQRLVNHSTFILLPCSDLSTGQENNGTLLNCKWVWLKARPYIPGMSILLQKLSEIKEKHYIRLRPGGHFSSWVYNIIQFKLCSTVCCIATVYFHVTESIQCLCHVTAFREMHSFVYQHLTQDGWGLLHFKEVWGLPWLHS